MDLAAAWRRWSPGLAVAGAIHGAVLIALLVEISDSPPAAAPPSLAVELLPAPPAPVPQVRPTPPQTPTEPQKKIDAPPMPRIALAPAVSRNAVTLPPPRPMDRAPDKSKPQPPQQQPQPQQASAAAQAQQARIATASAGDPDVVANWEAMVVAALDAAKRYPPSARFARQQATIYASFVVDRRGKVKMARLSRPSGIPDLDAEVLALLRRVRLPSPPASTPETGSTLVVPIDFSLTRG